MKKIIYFVWVILMCKDENLDFLISILGMKFHLYTIENDETFIVKKLWLEIFCGNESSFRKLLDSPQWT